jgi:hypothetical protein
MFLCALLILTLSSGTTFPLETVQDFLIKLDIKPLMHLLEILPQTGVLSFEDYSVWVKKKKKKNGNKHFFTK